MNYTKKDKLYIWLSIVFECKPRLANELIRYYEYNIEELYEDVSNGNMRYLAPMRRDTRQKLKYCASDDFINDFISNFEKRDVYAVTYDSDDYPKLLKEIYDPPLVLYCRGKKLDNSCKLPFTIIGTRHCTEYGEKMATLFGKVLAENGMTIVSGLAYGCDAFAAKGALAARGNPLPTIAVLGQGVCVEKHDYTRSIMEQILDRGIVISEMLPYSHATKGSFPLRNRIMSGMSEGVLVVEAGERSGTSITANAALDQNRTLFAIPGRITDRMSVGTNRLIRMGMAHAVFDVEDVLSHYGIEPDSSKVKGEKAGVDPLLKLDETGKKLYGLIEHGEKNIDELTELSGLSVENLNLYLTEMEFSGLIRQLPGRVYVVE
ncbi:MAG: DNA-processing protein DprA [Christensenellaceae bacterium]|nr:DNA-processing protein DprA [Christensenellaceae bacterium]